MHRNSKAVGEWLMTDLSEAERKAAVNILTVSYLLDGALSEDFENTLYKYAEHVTLSASAQSVITTLDAGPSEEDTRLKLAALSLFFHQDFLVDLHKTDYQKIADLLHTDLLRGAVRFPQNYGRELYDRYNDLFSIERADHIDTGAALSLLKPLEDATYHVGEFTCGPLGVVRSSELRFLPPKVSLPLWHCADPGCNYLHQVKLMEGDTALTLTRSQLSSALSKEIGPASDWGGWFQTLILDDPDSNGRDYYDIPLLVAETCHGDDRTSLLSSLLRSDYGDQIRTAIKVKKPQLDVKRIQPERLASELRPGEQLHAIMIADDYTIADTLDALISDRIIDIPDAEVRRSVTEVPVVMRDDVATEISRLGVRSKEGDPLALMATVIWDAYEACDAIADLEWRCQQRGSIANLSSPLEYIRTHDPADVVRDLILPSRDVTVKVAEEFGLSPASRSEPSIFTERLLWKMGFDVPLFDRRISRIKEHIAAFKTKVISCSERPTEEEREKIRSAGVNLFVSLENILEELLSFNVWLLLSDHFIDTKYVYRFCDAVECVQTKLVSHVDLAPPGLEWRPNSGNTLGSSLFYLRQAAELFKELVLRDREAYERPEDDFPHYDGQRFVLRHTELWSDTLDIELKRFASAFSDAVKLFERANIPQVRNGIDHHRSADSFPTPAEILSCLSMTAEGVDYISHQRLFPTPLWLEKASRDNVGRLEYTFMFSPTERLTRYGPSILLGLKAPAFSEPFVLPFGNLLGYLNSDLIFSVQADSPFSRYWRGYPRRQRVTVGSNDTAEEIANETVH
jgi:hypothetical protein